MPRIRQSITHEKCHLTHSHPFLHHFCGRFVPRSQLVLPQRVGSFLFFFLANTAEFLYPFSHDTSVCYSSRVMVGHFPGICPEQWPFFIERPLVR